MSPRLCLNVVSTVAFGHRGLKDTIKAREAYSTMQQCNATTPAVQSHSVHLPEGRAWLDELADKLTADIPEDVAVIRVDIGESSWQWDDLSSRQWPDRRSFGGLANRSLVDALTDVMAHVGDDWVQEHFKELRPGIARFVEEHAE